MEEVSVVIVGAGPSGLLLACQLARHGVSFRIIDGKSGPTLQSRAVVVQARSLEMYDQLSLAAEALRRGQRMAGLHIYSAGERRGTVDLNSIGSGLSPFAGTLILEQSENEAMLVAKLRELGHEVEWGVRCESVEQVEQGEEGEYCKVGVRSVAFGTSAAIRADWVCACDGARSAVRHALKVPFEGGTYPATFYVADLDITSVDEELKRREYGSMFLAKEGFALMFPMLGGDGHRVRLIGAVPSEAHELPGWLDNPNFSKIADAVREITGSTMSFAEPAWFATYSVHHRKVEQFRQGRVLIVGDAAHVHSPAGGQGMNTGLLDAHNLGWKLAYVARGLASETLLDSYHEEREAFARQLLQSTDTGFHFMSGRGALAAFLRMEVVPRVADSLLKISFVRSGAFHLISQIGIEYRRSALSKGHGRQSRVKAGDRFPPVTVQVGAASMECLDIFKTAGFHALDFTQANDEHAESAIERVAAKSGLPICYTKVRIEKKRMEGVGLGPLLYIVRPDMYIGMSSNVVNDRQVEQYLRENVGALM